MLFRFEGVAKEFGAQKIFDAVTMQANPGDRIGLIGRNGSGKTTLLDLIERITEPDAGQIHRANSLKTSRIEQIPQFDPAATLRDETLKVFRHVRLIEARLAQLETEMSRLDQKIPPQLAADYESSRVRLELEGGYDYQARTESVLLGLGFSAEAFDQPCSRLSGGQISRLLLARSLLRPANLLLLDEPTNHLDLDGIFWLTRYLKELKTSYLVISHDRGFLDAATEITWEIDLRRLHAYPGSFSQARRLKLERLRLEEKEYRRQQEWKARTEDYIRRNIAGQKTKQAQSRRKRLAKVDWIDKPGEDASRPALKIPEAQRGGALSLVIKDATFGYPSNSVLRGVNLVVRRGDRIALLGGNGSGKSTLLKTLVGEIPALGGEIQWGLNTVPSYFSQNPSLGGGDTVYDCLRELDFNATDEQLRGFAARFLFREDEIFKSVDSLSGGERSRVALARLLYHPTNVLILDEPTNHLDIQSREALEEALAAYGGTLLVVSHDLYFVEQVATDFHLIRDGVLEPLPGLDKLSERLAVVGFEAPPPTPAPPKPATTGADPAPPQQLSKNERKRRERAIRELEEKISELETRKSSLLEQLQERHDYARLHELSELHQEAEESLEDLYRQWEEASSELAGMS